VEIDRTPVMRRADARSRERHGGFDHSAAESRTSRNGPIADLSYGIYAALGRR
jgi:hypothetical protein